jgi:hypothetical protein
MKMNISRKIGEESIEPMPIDVRQNPNKMAEKIKGNGKNG